MITRSGSCTISSGNGRKLMRGMPVSRQRAIGSSMPRRERKYCRCASASGLYGGISFELPGGRPAAASAARAAANASSPSNSRIAPVATQMPERSGLPAAVRGAARSGFDGCAASGAVTAATAAAAKKSNPPRVLTSAPPGAGRRTARQLLAVGERDPAHRAQCRVIARRPALDGHRRSGHQCLVAPPALPHQHVRRIALETPARDGAGGVLHVDRKMKMRVRPFDIRDLTLHRHRLVAVEDGGERMMRSREARDENPETEHEEESESTHEGRSLVLTRIIGAPRDRPQGIPRITL